MDPIEVKVSPIAGQGVFTNLAVEPNSVIAKFDGHIITSLEELLAFPNHENTLQIGLGKYLVPDAVLRYLNHSCDPNCWIWIQGDNTYLVSLRSIQADEELTFDYGVTGYSDDWKMNCNCGTAKCYGHIGTFDMIPLARQQEYVKLGIVPDYVLNNYKGALDYTTE